MNEQAIQQQIRLHAVKRNVLLFRNNSGVATGADGRPIRFGLGNDSTILNASFKSSDLIGIRPVIVTPEMVGTLAGLFIAVEIKKPGYSMSPTVQAQQHFCNIVRGCGGIAGVVTSVEEFERLIT